MNERILSQLGQAVMETMMLLGKELLRRLVDNRNNGYVVYVGEGAGWIGTEEHRHFGWVRFIIDLYYTSERVLDYSVALRLMGECIRPKGKTIMTALCETYQRYLEPGFTPFDPLELASQTEKIVCRGNHRKYTKFYCTGVYGGIATGYACGCCLRCIFCWVNWSRDFPEKYGVFRSPAEAFSQLSRAARKAGVRQLRISGAEPTLGKSHLLGVLERVESSPFRLLILETNGILIGTDPDYARQIARFKKVHTRVSLKAGTPEAFTRKTGARPESFELPFRGIVNLMKAGASFHVAAMTADPRIVTQKERQRLLDRLASIHPALVDNLEEEVVDPYHTTLERLRYAGAPLAWTKGRTR